MTTRKKKENAARRHILCAYRDFLLQVKVELRAGRPFRELGGDRSDDISYIFTH